MKPRSLWVALALCAASASASAQEFVRIGSGLAGSYPVFGAKVAELAGGVRRARKSTSKAGKTKA